MNKFNNKGFGSKPTKEWETWTTEIADERECDPMDIILLENDTEGEICIYIKGKWCGYLEMY